MIVPTIGRVVLVHRNVSPQREPAFVTYIHANNVINVSGFGHQGDIFYFDRIELIQEDNQTPLNENLFAEWMPYQKTVAANEAAKNPNTGAGQAIKK